MTTIYTPPPPSLSPIMRTWLLSLLISNSRAMNSIPVVPLLIIADEPSDPVF